jgi:hypothetical protein
MSNNIQILNYNHNVISLSNGNTIIITDNVKGNSISIPQPVTSILQINSPGPQGVSGPSGSQGLQGPPGPSGSQGPSGSSSNIDTGSFAITGSNTFYGLQTISASTTDISALDIHTQDDALWALRIYNDTYSSSSIGLASWVDNTGISFLGTETDKPLQIYTNANYGYPTLTISSSGVTIDSTLTVNNGITGSLEGTASWTKNYNETDPVFTAVSGTFATTGSNTFIGDQIITGSVNISGSINIDGNNTSSNTAQFGTIGIQSYTVNNAWFGDNAYFNGSQFVRRQTGYSGLFYFQGDEGQFRFGDNDTSGSSITDGSGFGKVTLKTNLDGTFAVGDLSYASANYTGAKLIVDSTGKTGINTTTPHSDLEVNGTIGLQYKYVDLTATGNYVIGDNTPATVYRFSNASGTEYSVELPAASSYLNRIYFISRGIDDGGGNIQINCSSNMEYRDGIFQTSIYLSQNTRYQWISDGTQWVLVMYNTG